jgi:hypothetical protein
VTVPDEKRLEAVRAVVGRLAAPSNALFRVELENEATARIIALLNQDMLSI